MTISCNINDEACREREREITSWAVDYKREREAYILAYKNYLEKTLGGKNADREKTIMEAAHQRVKDELSKLNDNNALNGETLITKSKQIKESEDNIQKNNINIKNQDNSIHKLNISLLSKERQIEYTNERNRNRRIMVAVLIIINLILIFVAYMLYNK